MQPPERAEKAEAAGEIALEAEAAGLPKWSWHAAEPWTGDADGLKAAVAALHAKLAAGDITALRAARAPMNADFDALYGPEPADEVERFDTALKQARLQPLPPLEARPIGDGRRVLVTGPDLAAPIRYLGEGDMAGFRVDAGMIWAKLNGQWQIVR